MRKIVDIIQATWCAFTCFVSPVWLALIWLNITGSIYQYDYSMDEGTAIIIGIILVGIWIVASLVPNIFFWKKKYTENKKKAGWMLAVTLLLCVLGMTMCGWDVVGFWTT